MPCARMNQLLPPCQRGALRTSDGLPGARGTGRPSPTPLARCLLSSPSPLLFVFLRGWWCALWRPAEPTELREVGPKVTGCGTQAVYSQVTKPAGPKRCRYQMWKEDDVRRSFNQTAPPSGAAHDSSDSMRFAKRVSGHAHVEKGWANGVFARLPLPWSHGMAYRPLLESRCHFHGFS